ncbi:hypothetical protein GCM10027578_05520 [Spirosoma luteolum]
MLEMIAKGQGVPYVAQALGISEELIYKCKQRAKGEEKHQFSGHTSDVLIENQQLLQRVNQLEMEREILMKALSIVR